MSAILGITTLKQTQRNSNTGSTPRRNQSFNYLLQRYIPITGVMASSPNANMPVKATSPSIIDAWHHAVLISNISAFLTHDLGNNATITTIVPSLLTFLSHLAIRLNAYGWQLTTGTAPGLVYHLSTSSTLDIWAAVKAMEELARFLGDWMDVLRSHENGLSFANEEGLKTDLERVAKFIRTLFIQLPETWKTNSGPPVRRSSLRGGGDDDDPLAAMNDDPAHDQEADRQHEAVEALNNNLSPPRWTISTAIVSIPNERPAPDMQHTQVPEVPAAPQSRRLSNDSDISVLVSAMRAEADMSRSWRSESGLGGLLGRRECNDLRENFLCV